MKVITDTHSLIWFLFLREKLSNTANKSILEAENIFLPTIILLEGVQLCRKINLLKEFKYFLSKLPTPIFQVLPLDLSIVNQYLVEDEKLEIHDRIIVATAKYYGLPIVTRDGTITQLYPKIIW